MKGAALHVLHVVNSLEPGGMENGVVNLARGLSTRGIEMSVACLESRGAFADRLPHPERVTLLGKRHGFSFGAMLTLAHLIARERPDIVHSHNLGPLIYSALATGGGFRVPMVHGEHSALTEAEKTPRRLRQRRWLYRCCKCIHTVSETTRQEIAILRVPVGRLRAIPNGVDTEQFAPGDRRAARVALQLPEEALVIGVFGRFGPFKNHARLLDAFAQLAPRFPSLHLLIAGTGGPCEDEIRHRAARHPYTARVHLPGFLTNPAAAYPALDLLVAPSTNEGMSNVALEAMACGIPVLANSGCGFDEIITDQLDGRISDLRDVSILVAEVGMLLSDLPHLLQLGGEARRKAQRQHSIGRMLHQYEELYREIARRN